MHGVHRLLVEGNVAYNTMGHTYFLEDGVETLNLIRYNLGVLTRAAREEGNHLLAPNV